jgi:hypothetical protein
VIVKTLPAFAGVTDFDVSIVFCSREVDLVMMILDGHLAEDVG